ncbi:MAG: tetratricopeptide repeat protein [Acidobacteria bacterium]|nr:tetratricopeptide repeat protein [Acidobacteriota bacterium]
MKLGYHRKLLLAALYVLLAPAAAIPQDYKQAVAYYNQRQYDKAIQELKPFLDKNPDWESGHRLVGLCYLNLKNYALAIVELGRAVQLKSPAFVTYQALAQAYFNTDRLDNCIQTLTQGEPLAKTPSDEYSLHHLRGAAHYRLQRYDRAVEDLNQAVGIRATEWVDFSQLGVAYFNLDRYDEAIQALQKALTLKPGDAGTADVLGRAYFKQGVAALSAKQYNAALDLLRKAGAQAPNNGYVFYNTGEAYLFLNNMPEAEKAYAQARTLLPGNPDVLVRLGLVYERQKKWDLSLEAYRKANELNPSAALKESIARVTELKKM